MVKKSNIKISHKIKKDYRLKGWDYLNDGYYFVTICTRERKNFFGEIKNEKIFLSSIGKIAEKYWLEIPDHFQFVKLGEWVIMPNHIHGILIIDKSENVDHWNPTDCRDAINRVSDRKSVV